MYIQFPTELHFYLDTTRGRVFVIFREGQFPQVAKRYPELPLRPLFQIPIGGRNLVVADNRRPPFERLFTTPDPDAPDPDDVE